ncbi:MAG: hypothetical protein DRN28_01950 [Thermoplasmata archaeon]|nr:MAG: hypothetical protein DRN28_01950 [Thermoplasmata archaeon]
MPLNIKLSKNLIVLIVVTVIIGTIIAVVFLYGRGEVSRIDMSKPQAADFDGDSVEDGISFTVFGVAPGVQKVTGKGRYSIYYNGAKVYGGEYEFIEGRDMAEVRVPFERFVEGNGQYRIVAEAGGKKAEETFEVGFVVEALNISVSLVYSEGDYVVRVLVIPETEQGDNLYQTPLYSTVQMTFKDPRGNPQTEEIEQNTFPQGVFVSHTFEMREKGNYSLRVVWINEKVMETSPWKEVESVTTHYLDKPPFAHLDVPESVSLGADLSETVTLDGSGSTDDGEIISYTFTVTGPGTSWTYSEARWMEEDGEDNDGDGTTDEPGEAPDGTFDGITEFTFLTPGDYVVSLYVEDDNPYFPGGNTTTAQVHVTLR